jgi:hypothetical protein
MENPQDIYKDIEMIKLLAIDQAKKHNCNYNVILKNPDENGKFDSDKGSTYEFVADTYFEKPRPHAILLHKTDDLIKDESAVNFHPAIIGAGDIGKTTLSFKSKDSLAEFADKIMQDTKKELEKLTFELKDYHHFDGFGAYPKTRQQRRAEERKNKKKRK